MTPVEMPRGCAGMVSHGEPLLTLGSCFADEVGACLERQLFDVTVNPFGPLYNPASILRAVECLAHDKPVVTADLIESHGAWHSMLFHSRFSGSDRENLAEELTRHIHSLHVLLPSLKTVCITLGSTRCFIDRATGRVVANCHKLPASRFEECRMTMDETADAIVKAYKLLADTAPGLRIVVTVSPVRHRGAGFHADKLSKATLLLGAEKAVNAINAACAIGRLPAGAVYFPAYEIVDDELRDYRFYAADMLHPSDVAVDYIYSRFADTFFTPETLSLAERAAAVTTRLLHRPLNSEIAADTRRAALGAARIFATQNPAVAPALDRFISKHITV